MPESDDEFYQPKLEFLKTQYENLSRKRQCPPPESINKLLIEHPNPKNLQTLENWLEARSWIVIYDLLKTQLSIDNAIKSQIDTGILETNDWENIPSLFKKWAMNHAESQGNCMKKLFNTFPSKYLSYTAYSNLLLIAYF